VTRGDFVVADDQDNVIARTHTIVHENVVNMVDVWTHPGHRRQGHARHLLTTVLATYGPDVEYTLAVGRENMAAVALYRSLGFVETGGFIMTRAPGLTA